MTRDDAMVAVVEALESSERWTIFMGAPSAEGGRESAVVAMKHDDMAWRVYTYPFDGRGEAVDAEALAGRLIDAQLFAEIRARDGGRLDLRHARDMIDNVFARAESGPAGRMRA